MSGHSHNTKRGPIRWLFENSAFLIAGAIAALVWANVDNASYESFVHSPLWGEKAEGGHPHNTLAFIVNDILMAFFFAIAGKEVWESLLPGGSLANPKKAAVPLLATAGGMFGPIAVYMGGVFLFNGIGNLAEALVFFVD